LYWLKQISLAKLIIKSEAHNSIGSPINMFGSISGKIFIASAVIASMCINVVMAQSCLGLGNPDLSLCQRRHIGLSHKDIKDYNTLYHSALPEGMQIDYVKDKETGGFSVIMNYGCCVDKPNTNCSDCQFKDKHGIIRQTARPYPDIINKKPMVPETDADADVSPKLMVPHTGSYTDAKKKKVEDPFPEASTIRVLTFPDAVAAVYDVNSTDENGGEVAKLALQVENKAYDIPNVTNDTKAGTIIETLSKKHKVKTSEGEEVTLWEHACKQGYCQLQKHIWECDDQTWGIYGTDTMKEASNEMIDEYGNTDGAGTKGCLWDGNAYGDGDSVGYFSRSHVEGDKPWFHIEYKKPEKTAHTWVPGIEE
jgi:hypothetical protein